MDVKYINPFVNAVIHTLATMLGKMPERLAPALKDTNVAHGDISGIIGFAGQNVYGSVALSFPQETALKIYNLMMGETVGKISKEVQDTVGELVNIVAGGAKTELDEEGLAFRISIPTVVVGKNHTIAHKGNSPVVCIPFKLEACTFVMEICMRVDIIPGRIKRVAAPAQAEI